MTEQPSRRALQLRRHREVMLYALEHGLTPKAAEEAMVRESARLARERLALVQRCGRSAVKPAHGDQDADRPQRAVPDNAPWMMRD